MFRGLAVVLVLATPSLCLSLEGSLPVCSVHPLGSLHPHESSCLLYYHCTPQGPQVRSCPLGHHFSGQEHQPCLPQHLVPCNLEEFDYFDVDPFDNCPPNPTCTIFDNDVSKPYPRNCSMYTYCDFGLLTLKLCPNNEEFSPSQFQCMSAELANCPKCYITPTTTTTEATPTPELPICRRTPKCRPIEHGILKRYPPDCSKYIFCNEFGQGIISNCEEGLHFRWRAQTCVDPSIAHCQYCTPGNETFPPCPDIPVCLPEDVGTKKPYPPDCARYISCENSGPVLKECPIAEHFNPEIFQCMPEEEANCPDCEYTGTTPEPTTTLPPIPDCPKNPTCGIFENAISKPYPPDCKKYTFCDFGVPTIRSCDPGLEFSPTQFKCMDPTLANCPICKPAIW